MMAKGESLMLAEPAKKAAALELRPNSETVLPATAAFFPGGFLR
jgi:hypothetical protein